MVDTAPFSAYIFLFFSLFLVVVFLEGRFCSVFWGKEGVSGGFRNREDDDRVGWGWWVLIPWLVVRCWFCTSCTIVLLDQSAFCALM